MAAASQVKQVNIDMSNPIFDEIVKRVSATYPDSCICFIEEVVNDTLRKTFDAKKKTLEKRLTKRPGKNSVKVVQLFHGTTECAVSAICKTGFLTKFNKISAYGIGSYFARDAKYSFTYMHPSSDELSYMFLADVLVGKTILGNAKQVAPKNIDTMVDNISKPSIYVTPYDDGAYPRYVIAFHKDAK